MNLFKPDIDQLVFRARTGDQKAFAGLYNLHVSGLFRFLNQFSSNRDQTAEWVQLSFIKAFTKIEQFAGKSTFKTWLFRIGLNEMRTGVRKAAPDEMEYHEEHDEVPENDPLLQQDLSIWLKHLDHRHRAVLLLAEAEGYSHAEIAEMMQISESSSRSMLSRAKSRLRNHILTDMNYGKKHV